MAGRRLFFLVVLGAACLSGAAARPDPILGLWRVEPDFKGQVGEVAIRMCEEAFCGRVVHVVDRTGAPVVTRSMGRDLFWGLQAQGNGSYGGGRVWVPLRDKVYAAKARLEGDRLRVLGCLGAICDGQTWVRIR
ncbi:MAG: DUF2147 domain-containing protein [Rhodobacteraceae bacterium]|nr:DUF2147 domain-containing protein [Paracoccaceae bacterium]MCP5341994.1 DUF2147 domain-containing protein [Paracoccaceae bacterium]